MRVGRLSQTHQMSDLAGIWRNLQGFSLTPVQAPWCGCTSCTQNVGLQEKYTFPNSPEVWSGRDLKESFKVFFDTFANPMMKVHLMHPNVGLHEIYTFPHSQDVWSGRDSKESFSFSRTPVQAPWCGYTSCPQTWVYRKDTLFYTHRMSDLTGIQKNI